MTDPNPARSDVRPTATPAEDRAAPVGLKSDLQATRTLVIGYGSPIRGDDAIGPLAADALGAQDLPRGVRVISRHVLTAELVEDIAATDQVVFLDAAVDGEPGEVRVRELEPDAAAHSTMAHFLDPRELLAWCQTLYGRAPKTWLVSAVGLRFDYASYALSPVAASALAPMMARVRDLIGAESG